MEVDKWVVIIDAKIMFDLGHCETKEEALYQFKEQYPQFEKRSKYIHVRKVREEKSDVSR